MHKGHYISGAGHLGLIAWLLLGNLFTSRPEAFEMQEVSVISAAEFDAMVASTQAPDQTTEVAQPAAPQASAETPQIAATEDQQIQQPPPEPARAPQVDETPDVAVPAPPPPPPPAEDVSDLAPESPEPPAEVAVLVPETAPVAVPRPVERVAPEAVATPAPDARTDVIEQQAATPDAPAEKVVEEAQEETAPEEATTQIVTEATEAPKAAPNQSPRPPARRPEPPAPQVAEVAPEPKPAPTPPEPTPPKPTPPKPAPPDPAPTATTDKDAVAAALAEAMGTPVTPAAATSAPSGPPLSAGEKESLRVAVSACWNVGSLSSDALRTTVVVSVAMNQDGTPQTNTITMTGSSGGSPAAAGQAFEAARRAIIRCGSRGYQLPVEKFGQWQNIEMTFNPERMRIK